MFSFRLLVATTGVAALLVTTAPTAFADSLPARLRGTITAMDDGGITLHERDGRTFTLSTGPGTTYADVVPSSLGEIKVNDYIGSAVKGPRDHLIAVEIVLVPKQMQANRIGYYAWDPLPDTSGIEASGVIDTTMTNGLVSGVTAKTPAMTKTALMQTSTPQTTTPQAPITATSMTNGTVVTRDDGTTVRTLTVDLAGDRRTNIQVSSTAPVVRFVPSDRSTISVGSNVVVWTQPGNVARLVAVGKGVTPPM